MSNLWNQDVEMKFFIDSMKYASPEQLFYVSDKNEYFAYWPKGYKGKKSTLQSRNSLIGQFTERWSQNLLNEVVNGDGLYAVQGAVCPEIALPNNSPGDVVISSTNSIKQSAENIKVIIEVKMSIVWNWLFENDKNGFKLSSLGDYNTHSGTPGLLRSDSMLKAIGKSINIRVSGISGAKIPIIILGNTPIQKSYFEKVDHLKVGGIVQGFWSVNPNPLDNKGGSIKNTNKDGFRRFDLFDDFKTEFNNLLSQEMNFFTSMKTKSDLGKIIEIANHEKTYEQKAEAFLNMIRR